MSATKSSASTSQESTNGTGQTIDHDARETRQDRESHLDQITSLINGGPPSDASKDERAPREKAGKVRTDDPDAADHPGRERNSPLESPRPGLELDDDEDLFPDEARARKAATKAKTIKEFAEESQIDADALYSLLVPSDNPEDEPRTIGQLKDAYREMKDFQVKADLFEDARMEAQNQITVGRQHIDQMLGRLHQILGGERMAQMFDDVSRDFQENVRQAKERVREYFPEWHDQKVFEKDQRDFFKLMGSYGFKQSEIESVIDARLIKFGIDAMRLRGRYERSKERFTRESNLPRDASSPRKIATSSTRTADELARKGDTLGAVDALIRGTGNDHRQSR